MLQVVKKCVQNQKCSMQCHGYDGTKKATLIPVIVITATDCEI
jgi:hypothetical protein